MRNTKKKFIFLLLIAIVLSVVFVLLFIKQKRISEYKSLVLDIPKEEVVGKRYFLSPYAEKGSTNENDFEEYIVIKAVSTGEFSNFIMRDDNGRDLASATKMRVVTKNVQGGLAIFDVVLQITPLPPEDTQKNLIYWLLGRIDVKGKPLGEISRDVLSREDLLLLIPKGSRLELEPMTNPDWEYLGNVPKYAQLAKEYYGKSLPELNDYISGGLTINFEKPILLNKIRKIQLE